MRYLLLFLYYGVLRHLPASSTRYTKWIRPLRRMVCTPLFARAGANINVESGASFGTGRNIEIGKNSGIGVNCEIHGKVIIGGDVLMGPHVLLLTRNHAFRGGNSIASQGYEEEIPLRIEDDVWIGARAIILPGAHLSKGMVVGAGAVVTKPFPPYSIVAGNPARCIGIRRT